jgi:hypothetical protein
MVVRKCSKCGANINIDETSKQIVIETNRPLCYDCLEFLKSLGEKK